MRVIKYLGLILGIASAIVIGSGAKGYLDALREAEPLRGRADELIAQGRGGASLGAGYLAILLRVEDPGFAQHCGVDFSTPGAGMTTISQSAAKRLAFAEFRPGFAKIRQTGYALGLERRLSKEQILALWLDTLEMGNGPNGWLTGFHQASWSVYGRPPAALGEAEFVRLVAVLIAPGAYSLTGSDARLDERVARIERLLAGRCLPSGFGDVWLDGCQLPPD